MQPSPPTKRQSTKADTILSLHTIQKQTKQLETERTEKKKNNNNNMAQPPMGRKRKNKPRKKFSKHRRQMFSPKPISAQDLQRIYLSSATHVCLI